jgi:hypothetical protein
MVTGSPGGNCTAHQGLHLSWRALEFSVGSTEMAKTSAVAFVHAHITLLWTQMCATHLHGILHAGPSGLGVLRKP